MKRTITVLAITVASIFGPQPLRAETPIAVVPKPLRIERNSGQFVLNSETAIRIDKDSAEQTDVAKLLAERLRRATGFELPIAPSDDSAVGRNAIVLTTRNARTELGPEGYTLEATPDGVTITARAGAGLFYGTQTLLELLPPQVFAADKIEGVLWAVPAVKIEDRPRFGWRGLLLDVARHFFNKREIENFIDLMAQHKFNALQLHLTDDEGWRLEIKRYPRLTAKSAWRTNDPWRGTEYPADKPYGGFFTQDEMRQIVAYAKARYVNVVPEIEMPAHTGGAIAAYPELSCTGKPAGEICPGKDSTYEFLQNVLGEVVQVFPSKYIHIGGDEASKRHWKTCPKCQALMRREGLKDVNELQSYFVRRMEKFLNAQGRTLVGWDEILEGGVAPNAVVMSWRGMEGGLAAASAGHDAVMTPTAHCYFDYPQAKSGEPQGFGSVAVPLRAVYAFEPIPRGLAADKASHILGAGGNLWSEMVFDYPRAQYMVYPRACALAEVAWSDAKLKDWADFRGRLDEHLKRLKAQGVNYRQPQAADAAK